MSHAEHARDLFRSGYNCAQAVVGAFVDAYGVDKEPALRMTAALGGGVARQREVCGAVLGMGIVLGMAAGTSNAADHDAKTALYRRTQALCARFAQEMGSIICRELLSGKPTGGNPEERTEQYYKKKTLCGTGRVCRRIDRRRAFDNRLKKPKKHQYN